MDSVVKTQGNIDKGNLGRAYIWSSSGAIFAASGPSVFMLMITAMVKEVSVMYFLFIGGLAALLVGYIWRKSENDALEESWDKLLDWRISGQILFAGLFLAAHFVFFIYAMQVQSITETIIFVRISPLIVVFLSAIILKKQEKVRSWTGIVFATILSVSGIAIINKINSFSPESFLTSFFLFAITATCSYAFFRVMTVSIKNQSGLSGGAVSGLTMIAGSFGLLVWIVATGSPLIMPGTRELLFLSYLGIATVALGVFANLKAVKLIGAQGKIAFVEYLQAIFGPVFAYLINKEVGLDYSVIIIGGLLIVGGAICANLSVETKK